MLNFMNQTITIYPEPKGANLSINILIDGNNACKEVAKKLYDIALEENAALERKCDPYAPNHAYSFGNKLVFWLNQKPPNENEPRLEFFVPKELGPKTGRLMAHVPRLLKNAGVEEQALTELNDFLLQKRGGAQSGIGKSTSLKGQRGPSIGI
jgi:hypothetical protein